MIVRSAGDLCAGLESGSSVPGCDPVLHQRLSAGRHPRMARAVRGRGRRHLQEGRYTAHRRASHWVGHVMMPMVSKFSVLAVNKLDEANDFAFRGFDAKLLLFLI